METSGGILEGILPQYVFDFVSELDEHPWLFSALASILVGLSGILPLLIIPIDETASFQDGKGAATLRILLSFAVGGLLGDVFLHLLPEAWAHDMRNTPEGEHIPLRSGLWCLCGMLVFIVVEKLFAATEEPEEPKKKVAANGAATKQFEIEEIDKLLEMERRQRAAGGAAGAGGAALPNGLNPRLYETCLFNNNGSGSCCAAADAAPRCGGSRWMGRCLLREARDKAAADTAPPGKEKQVAGYLNLMANSIDNFTHGLAVGGSFLVGFRVGVLTTFAILVHEIPHEVGDFAILLRSGFTRWEAAKAQLATASAGLIGAMTAVVFSGANNAIEAKTSWIVPFTAGGFLHIALVTVLPELQRAAGAAASAAHLLALAGGVALMAALTHYCH